MNDQNMARMEERFENQDFLNSLKAAGTPEELVKKFADEGVEVTAEEAEQFLNGRSQVQEDGELDATALDAVAGGGNRCFFHGIFDGVTGKDQPGKKGFFYKLGYAYGSLFR